MRHHLLEWAFATLFSVTALSAATSKQVTAIKRPSFAAPTQRAGDSDAPCPTQAALDLFRHQIAYERTEETYPLKGLSVVHASVWLRGSASAFYVHDRLSGYVPGARMTYIFVDGYLDGGGGCPAEENWIDCIEKSPALESRTGMPRTCTVTINMRAIPPWAPSKNDSAKRRVAAELLHQIEEKWKGAQEIVIRDFNISDPQITAYIKMPDGDYFQGCGFKATGIPPCSGWHLFGMVPDSKIREWIFQRPYRLK